MWYYLEKIKNRVLKYLSMLTQQKVVNPNNAVNDNFCIFCLHAEGHKGMGQDTIWNNIKETAPGKQN